MEYRFRLFEGPAAEDATRETTTMLPYIGLGKGGDLPTIPQDLAVNLASKIRPLPLSKILCVVISPWRGRYVDRLG